MRKGVLVVVAVCVSAVVLAAEGKDEGWKRLFDGKTLEGWKASEKPDHWKVEEGTIVGRGSRSHLFYVAEEFKDFHFKADVMTQPGTNSGIYFHSKFQEGGWPEHGYESQVNVTHGDPVKTGSIYNVVKIFETPAKDGKWWTQHIIVKGKSITTMIEIDGKVLFRYEYVEPPSVAQGSEKRRLSKGLFAFQQHDPGSVVRYRNVMVKPLP